jgi:30S ribosomal protein S31
MNALKLRIDTGLFYSIDLGYLHKINIMGRGDKKTKKGKIFKASFGKSRPAKPTKKNTAASPEKKEE